MWLQLYVGWGFSCPGLDDALPWWLTHMVGKFVLTIESLSSSPYGFLYWAL